LNFVYRSQYWWNFVVLETFDQHDFMQNFRMNKDTFNYLCDQLRPSLQHTDTVMRKSISVEMRVAVTLWFLATPAEYRTISHIYLGLAEVQYAVLYITLLKQ